ncbi:hypothetical protein JAAARDRAFT_35344 [Jaapia argillacea MUCL 33604]|uniref:Uncharacterized protein n=1 Tax=Jaapia argillacea MUCL 33604 TaxID=933084 RepID=A0A067PUW2_9AGAM|nr:hypothetical protein JAAARDRAFT_35344 [Jaapia argillacea MUCL 33604]
MVVSTAMGVPLALDVVRVVSPAIVSLSTLSIIFTRASPPTSPSEITSVVVATPVPRRALILALLSLSALTYFLDGLTYVVFAVLDKVWPQQVATGINTVLGLAAFGGMAAIGAWKDIKGIDVWSRKRVKAAIFAAVVLDVALIVLLGESVHVRKPGSPKVPELPEPFPISISALLHLAFPIFRVLVLLPLYFALLYPRVVFKPAHLGESGETPISTSSLLLPSDEGVSTSTGLSPLASKNQYGTFRSGRSVAPGSSPTTRTHTPTPSHIQLPPVKSSQPKQEISPDPTWHEIWIRLRHITPYLWPTKNFGLQLLASICIFILLIGRFVNALVPLILGGLVRIFEDGSGRSPWPYLFAYVGMKFLQGSGGLAAVRDTLWAPVMQYSDREMSQLAFDHLLNLSLAFHTRRKTGEVLRILDRGSAINRTFELLLFNICPTFLDLFIALGIFIWKFDWTLAVVIFFVMFAYVAASVILTQWRTKLRRQMNDRDVVTRGIHTDCLLNYETVKYFNGEEHEGNRYRDAIREYQQLEYRVITSLNLLNLVQNLIITLGLLIGSIIVATRVTSGQLHASDFVVFITYLSQLYGPLNSLGYIYRTINQSLVDAEKLLRLLDEDTDVNDKPNATELVVTDGEIEFDNVNFSYDGRSTALNGVSFKVPKGSSVALVGESGSGKSTILRLLYRFYDLKDSEGRILIDGQDIRDVTQASLRRAIGVVPQDSVLFNHTIAYNIGYGKFGSSPEEVEAAAKAAQMHDRIISFPDGYETKVGERGVRLSGGEKQRVAIARTLLKNPPILLLDEATSALDTSTEKDIQKALQNLVQGRSSLSIAHRLSTIASADIILVLKEGKIVEYGSHSDLLARGGIFATMWADQTSDEQSIPAPVPLPAHGYSLDQEPAPVVEPEGTKEVPEEVRDLLPADEEVVETPEEDLVDIAQTDNIEQGPVSEGDVPSSTVLPPPSAAVAFPTSEDDTAEPSDDPEPQAAVAFPAVGFPVTEDAPVAPSPVAFPASEESSQRSHSGGGTPAVQAPGVTFVAEVGSPPSRTGTPDPESEPKRKRISSQNFQRLARRISLSRRAGSSSSSIFPTLKRESSVTSTPKDEGASKGEGTISARDGESPTPSVGSDTGKLKKEKKEKKRKTLL